MNDEIELTEKQLDGFKKAIKSTFDRKEVICGVNSYDTYNKKKIKDMKKNGYCYINDTLCIAIQFHSKTLETWFCLMFEATISKVPKIYYSQFKGETKYRTEWLAELFKALSNISSGVSVVTEKGKPMTIKSDACTVWISPMIED